MLMKKLMLFVLVLGIALTSFASIKEKDVIGTWKYKVETDQEDLTGTITIEKKEGKLVAEVNTDEGEVFAISKVEIKDNDVLYMELDTGYELLELSLTVKGKTMEGKVGSEQGSFPMTCEKVE
jgi:hypothetical protein